MTVEKIILLDPQHGTEHEYDAIAVYHMIALLIALWRVGGSYLLEAVFTIVHSVTATEHRRGWEPLFDNVIGEELEKFELVNVRADKPKALRHELRQHMTRLVWTLLQLIEGVAPSGTPHEMKTYPRCSQLATVFLTSQEELASIPNLGAPLGILHALRKLQV